MTPKAGQLTLHDNDNIQMDLVFGAASVVYGRLTARWI